MIDAKKVIQNIDNKLDSMTPAEQKVYLQKMGFQFADHDRETSVVPPVHSVTARVVNTKVVQKQGTIPRRVRSTASLTRMSQANTRTISPQKAAAHTTFSTRSVTKGEAFGK